MYKNNYIAFNTSEYGPGVCNNAQKYGKPCFRAEFRGPPSHPPWHSHPFVAAYSIAQAGTKHLLVALSPDPALTIVVGGSSICAAGRKIAV